jgi:hypothetical protein
MRDTSDLHSITDAAEQAGANEDWATAEDLLRQALTAQEGRFGPKHPDLANTLNNLGVACEKTGKEDEAERCYRRAYAIAAGLLPPDDPLVVTSGQNLREFCDARGRTFDPPAPVAVPSSQAAQPEASVSRDRPPAAEAQTRGFGKVAAGVVIAVGLLLVLFAVSGTWFGSDGTPEPPREPEPVQQAIQTVPLPAVTQPSASAAPAPPPEGGATPDPSPARAAERASPQAADPSPVSVVSAELCRPLSADWRCTPATNPAGPGLFSFYTRVRSLRDTDIEHRWYYEGRLLQTVTLRVTANQGAGYRTYSRNTITAERPGSWSVELRSQNGTVLHETRFQVLR